MTVAPTGPEYVPANSDFEPIVSPPSDLEFAEPSEQQHVEEHSQPSQIPPVAPGMESEQLPSAPTPSESDDTPVSDIPATILTYDTPNTVFSVLSDTQVTDKESIAQDYLRTGQDPLFARHIERMIRLLLLRLILSRTVNSHILILM